MKARHWITVMGALTAPALAAAPNRSAAEITLLKVQVEADLRERGVELDKETGKFTDPTPPAPPVPGEMTGGRPSLLGVEYGDPGITANGVAARQAYSKEVERIQASIAPKLKEQDDLKEKIYQEKEKAWREAEKLNNERNKGIDDVRKRYAKVSGKGKEESEEIEAIERRYRPRIQGLRQQEKDLWQQYYAVDETKKRIRESVTPQMEQTNLKFQQQTKSGK